MVKHGVQTAQGSGQGSSFHPPEASADSSITRLALALTLALAERVLMAGLRLLNFLDDSGFTVLDVGSSVSGHVRKRADSPRS
jgi:hypothetical protein